MNLELSGKRALVTGGTKGIGRAIVEALCAEGCGVALCARDSEGVEAALAELRAQNYTVWGEAVNVREPDAVQSWVARSAEQMGGLDIVVSNVSAATGEWRAMFETDVMSAVHLVEAALPWLRQSQAASIVAIASRAAYTGDGAYAAMKCALISYIKGISESHAGEGIRANTVSPGDIYFAGGVWEEFERTRPDIWADAQERNRMGRLGRPEEVARVVAFVASPAASFVSGANVRVDGAGSRSTQF